MLLDASNDLRAEILDIVSDGTRVGIRIRYTGTDSGGLFPGTEATGRTFDIEGMDIFVANDAGRFVEHYGILDLRAAMSQLGLVPSATPTSATD
jgi:predicted ester cyclase